MSPVHSLKVSEYLGNYISVSFSSIIPVLFFLQKSPRQPGMNLNSLSRNNFNERHLPAFASEEYVNITISVKKLLKRTNSRNLKSNMYSK